VWDSRLPWDLKPLVLMLILVLVTASALARPGHYTHRRCLEAPDACALEVFPRRRWRRRWVYPLPPPRPSDETLTPTLSMASSMAVTRSSTLTWE
jgi:hypothetical protein